MPTSNGLTTPTMPAMAEPGSNRALTASLPSPARIPEPGSSKIGGSRAPLTLKTPKTQGMSKRSLPGAAPSPTTFHNPIKIDQAKKQQRMQAVQDYHSRLKSGSAEHPAAFLQSISHLF